MTLALKQLALSNLLQVLKIEDSCQLCMIPVEETSIFTFDFLEVVLKILIHSLRVETLEHSWNFQVLAYCCTIC